MALVRAPGRCPAMVPDQCSVSVLPAGEWAKARAGAPSAASVWARRGHPVPPVPSVAGSVALPAGGKLSRSFFDDTYGGHLSASGCGCPPACTSCAGVGGGAAGAGAARAGAGGGAASGRGASQASAGGGERQRWRRPSETASDGRAQPNRLECLSGQSAGARPHGVVCLKSPPMWFATSLCSRASR